MKFYLGTHEPTWLNRSHRPLFVSAVRLRARCVRKLPTARVPWALDSGGFSCIQGPDGYAQKAPEYAAEVRRWAEGIGLMDWAAVQDWMCEPVKLALTGKSVREHQELTVQSYLDLRALAPEIPWVPVLQGFARDEYHRCAELYAAAGVELRELGLVGIGSVCRREHTGEAEAIIRELAATGLRLHGFGFKLSGLERCADALASADSLAWSDGARRAARAGRGKKTPSLFGCAPPVRSPQNSPAVALEWMDRVQVRAGIKAEPQLAVCPFCESGDVVPPLSSLEWCCVNCGEAWGDLRAPDL